MTVSGLNLLCEILDLGKFKTKDKIIDGIMDFLKNPIDSGKVCIIKLGTLIIIFIILS